MVRAACRMVRGACRMLHDAGGMVHAACCVPHGVCCRVHGACYMLQAAGGTLQTAWGRLRCESCCTGLWALMQAVSELATGMQKGMCLVGSPLHTHARRLYMRWHAPAHWHAWTHARALHGARLVTYGVACPHTGRHASLNASIHLSSGLTTVQSLSSCVSPLAAWRLAAALHAHGLGLASPEASKDHVELREGCIQPWSDVWPVECVDLLPYSLEVPQGSQQLMGADVGVLICSRVLRVGGPTLCKRPGSTIAGRGPYDHCAIDVFEVSC